LGGVRIPFARGNGTYAQAGNQELLTAALRGLVERYGLRGQRLDEVVAGAVMKHPSQWNLTRESVLGAGLAAETPGLDLERACGTSLEAAILVANKIALGQIDCAIAAGVDTVSDPPVVFPRVFQQLLLKSLRGKSGVQRLRPWLQARPRHWRPVLPGITEPRTGLSMGESAELMVKTWGITREDQDRLAMESHRKAAAAYDEGFYERLVHAHRGLSQDEHIRTEVNRDALGRLPPLYDALERGTLTAANTSPMTDGASAVLIACEEWARERDLPVLAHLTFGKVAAIDHVRTEGLLPAPAYAVARMLEDADLELQDFDYYEIHEASAGEVLCTLKAWENSEFCRARLESTGPLGSIDRTRLNVKGGSIAFGHPYAATGARMLATLAKLLHDDRTAKRGLICIGTAGGMGVTAILER
jgi:acetyl-CoA C-acetyltransferase